MSIWQKIVCVYNTRPKGGVNMNLTIEEAYEKYISYVYSKKKPQTYRTVKSRLKTHLLPFFQGILVNEITADKYLEWQKFILNKNYSYKYIKGLHISADLWIVILEISLYL